MKNVKLFLMLLIALLLLAACGGGEETAVEPSTSETVQTSADEEAMDEEAMDEEMMEDDAMSEDMEMTEHEEGMAELEETMEEAEEVMEEDEEETAVMADGPAWMNIALTDVRSGESFTFADLAGKTVFVEPMATWCTNCRRQLLNVTQAKEQLGETEDVVFVALSVETSISDAELLDYTEQTGYFFTFAVATPEMLISLVDSFGQTITNPPSTPHFIIRPDGSTTELVTGFEGPDDIIASIQAES